MMNVGCQKVKHVDLNVGPRCRCDEVEGLYTPLWSDPRCIYVKSIL